MENNNQEYVPNFSDPRVIKRIKRVLGFTLAMLSESKPRQMNKTGYLDKVFGMQNNPLSKYLRSKCLICVDNSYRFISTSGDSAMKSKMKSKHKFSFNDSASYCKTYIQNVEGVNQLIVDSMMSASDVEEVTQKNKRTSYFNKTTISTNAYCNTSLSTQDLSAVKHELAMDSARELFGDQFSSKNITYKDKANRLWNPAQNLPKTIKQPLHLEYGYAYEYDIECSAPTLLLQYARQHGLKKADWIDFYLANKTEVRNDLAETHKIDLQTVKVIITALFSGARMDRSIAEKISNHRKLTSFRNDPFVKALQKDISKLWRILKPTMGIQYNQDGEQTDRLSSSAKWKVYYQLERQVLDVVIKYLKTTKNDVALEHDGWTTTNRINTDELIDEVKMSTGYVIKLSEVMLKDVCLVACY